MTVHDDSPQCWRETTVGEPPIGVVRCVKWMGHKGPHVFVIEWRDPRDDAD